MINNDVLKTTIHIEVLNNKSKEILHKYVQNEEGYSFEKLPVSEFADDGFVKCVLSKEFFDYCDCVNKFGTIVDDESALIVLYQVFEQIATKRAEALNIKNNKSEENGVHKFVAKYLKSIQKQVATLGLKADYDFENHEYYDTQSRAIAQKQLKVIAKEVLSLNGIKAFSDENIVKVKA